MTAKSPRPRSLLLGFRRFRLVTDIAGLDSSQVTERSAPVIRLEGPDIALSGRQILL